MYLHMIRGRWIAIKGDKTERSDTVHKSDENVTSFKCTHALQYTQHLLKRDAMQRSMGRCQLLRFIIKGGETDRQKDCYV